MLAMGLLPNALIVSTANKTFRAHTVTARVFLVSVTFKYKSFFLTDIMQVFSNRYHLAISMVFRWNTVLVKWSRVYFVHIL